MVTAPTTMETPRAGTWNPVPVAAQRQFQPDRGGAITAPNDEQLITDCAYTTKFLTQTEKDDLITFYRVTTKQGSLRFDMTDPDSGLVKQFKFVAPPDPQIGELIDEYVVALALQRFDN